MLQASFDEADRGDRSMGRLEIAVREEQPGEFQRWGRNHKNSASGCSIYFSRTAANL
jgi:hypothetical protein